MLLYLSLKNIQCSRISIIFRVFNVFVGRNEICFNVEGLGTTQHT